MGNESIKLIGEGEDLEADGNNYIATNGNNLSVICKTLFILNEVSIYLEHLDQNGTRTPLAWSNQTNTSRPSSVIFTIHEMSPLYEGIYLCHVSTALDNFTVDLYLSYQEKTPTTPITPTTLTPTTPITSTTPASATDRPTTIHTSSMPATSVNQLVQKSSFCISEVKEGIVWKKTLAGMTAASACAHPAHGMIYTF